MKTKKNKLNKILYQQLYNSYKEVCADEKEIEQTIKDARRAFSFVQKDVLYKNRLP